MFRKPVVWKLNHFRGNKGNPLRGIEIHGTPEPLRLPRQDVAIKEIPFGGLKFSGFRPRALLPLGGNKGNPLRGIEIRDIAVIA